MKKKNWYVFKKNKQVNENIFDTVHSQKGKYHKTKTQDEPFEKGCISNFPLSKKDVYETNKIEKT